MITPSLEVVRDYEGSATHATLSLELAADTETPISLYFKLSGDRPNAFLFESVERGTVLGRYSIVGFDIENQIDTSSGDPLEAVQRTLAAYDVFEPEGLPRFHGGAVGYAGYDTVRHFEKVPIAEGAGIGIPESCFLLTENVAILDHLRQRVILVTHIPLGENRDRAYGEGCSRLEQWVDRLARGTLPPPREVRPSQAFQSPEFVSNMAPEAFQDAVRVAKEAIREGEVFQVVLSQRLTVQERVSPLALYRAVRGVNPSPYMFFLRFQDFAVVGASPEVLVRKEGDEILLRPIAGTRPRGKTPAEDHALESELLRDQKELAEHRMLLDLGRNDLGRVAGVGTVRVEAREHIERYSHVMHIVSDVYGRIRPDVDAYDVLRAAFPAGTVSGAPKIRAMELISELETDRRGLYSGAVGYFSFQGNMDTCIAIRTLVVTDDAVHVQAGAGIVADSDPEREHHECMHKAGVALRAIAEALEEVRQ